MGRTSLVIGTVTVILGLSMMGYLGGSTFVYDTCDTAGHTGGGDDREGLCLCPDHVVRMQETLKFLQTSGKPQKDVTPQNSSSVRTDIPDAPDFADCLNEPEDGSPQSWTFLFYNDADFSNAYNPFVDFVLSAHSDVNVNVLMLEDRLDGPCRLWYIGSNRRPVVLENWGEADMGHSNTLRKFIGYGKTHYAADRYFLALYDHGGGWMGACVDLTNKSMLSMSEISTALTSAGGVNIIAFTAPCMMGAIESAYQLRNCTNVYIGSEDISGYAAWHGIMDDICEILNDSSGLTNVDIAKMVVELVEKNPYWASLPYGGEEWITMSAVKSSKTREVASQIDILSRYSTVHMARLFDDLKPAVMGAWRMGQGNGYNVGEIDLYHFVRRFADSASDPVAAANLLELKKALNGAVIAEHHGWAQVFAYGLSVYCPRFRRDYNGRYATSNLDFTKDTGWDEFLQAYYTYMLKPRGSITGVVYANCPSPETPLYGVTVGLYETATGDLLRTDITGVDGGYAFENIRAGDFEVSVVVPLGYDADAEEWDVTIAGGDELSVDVSLLCGNAAGNTRGVGYWKHQVAVATGGNGSAQIQADTLCGYLDAIATHFTNNDVNSVGIYNPPEASACAEKLEAAKLVLVVTSQTPMVRRARQHVMALLLNVAANNIAQHEVVSVDGATVSQAITYCNSLLTDEDGKNDRLAKNIAEMINESHEVPSGMIPLATPGIAYAPLFCGGEMPQGFYLEQNFPNPFNPSTTIRFSLPEQMRATLTVYEVSGKLVKELVDEELAQGVHTVPFDATMLASGVYFFKLETKAGTMTKKLVIAK